MKPTLSTATTSLLLHDALSALHSSQQTLVKRFGPFLSVEVHACDATGALIRGKLDEDLGLEQAREALRLCLTKSLMALTNSVGDMTMVKRLISVHGFICGTTESRAHIDNLKSTFDLLVSLFGASGKGVQTLTIVDHLPHDGAAALFLMAETQS